MRDWAGQIVAVGNTALLQARANALGIDVKLTSYTSTDTAKPHRAGYLPVIDLPLSNDCQPGEPEPLNASYVLTQLELAASLCLAGEFQGMVTAPVHKAVINDAGTPFSGHTEFLADTTGAQHVIMLLATGALRVALATTHLPLRHVPETLSSDVIEQTLRTLHADLINRFDISEPRIAVLWLNPHAGGIPQPHDRTLTEIAFDLVQHQPQGLFTRSGGGLVGLGIGHGKNGSAAVKKGARRRNYRASCDDKKQDATIVARCFERRSARRN